MIKDHSQAVIRSKWLTPVSSLGLGVVIFAPSRLGGPPGPGLVSFAIMAGFGLFLLLAGRSETIRGFRGAAARAPVAQHRVGEPAVPCAAATSVCGRTRTAGVLSISLTR